MELKDIEKESIKLIQKKYHIKEVVLTGNRTFQSTENKGQLATEEGELKSPLHRKKSIVPEGIILTLTEFSELYHASLKGEKSGGILCSVFIDPENLFCLHVPDELP